MDYSRDIPVVRFQACVHSLFGIFSRLYLCLFIHHVYSENDRQKTTISTNNELPKNGTYVIDSSLLSTIDNAKHLQSLICNTHKLRQIVYDTNRNQRTTPYCTSCVQHWCFKRVIWRQILDPDLWSFLVRSVLKLAEGVSVRWDVTVVNSGITKIVCSRVQTCLTTSINSRLRGSLVYADCPTLAPAISTNNQDFDHSNPFSPLDSTTMRAYEWVGWTKQPSVSHFIALIAKYHQQQLSSSKSTSSTGSRRDSNSSTTKKKSKKLKVIIANCQSKWTT